jgi:hypothetical protein
MSSRRALSWFTGLAAVALTILLVYRRDALLDFFVEGDDDPQFLLDGRYAGIWEFQGDESELAELAGPSWHRIQFHSAGDGEVANEHTGVLHIAGQEYRLLLRASFPTAMLFEQLLPDLTERAYGDRLEVMLEAARLPENDWLFVFFGRDSDGGQRGFAYARPSS